jgi:hypothetical protein
LIKDKPTDMGKKIEKAYLKYLKERETGENKP